MKSWKNVALGALGAALVAFGQAIPGTVGQIAAVVGGLLVGLAAPQVPARGRA